MAKPIVAEVQIARPVEEVFDYLLQFENEVNWNQSLTRCELLSGESGVVGAKYQQARKMMGQEMTASIELTDIEPGKRFVFRGTGGPAKITGTYEVAASDGGSLVTASLEAGTMTSLMKPVIKPQLEKSLAELKKLLEEGQRDNTE